MQRRGNLTAEDLGELQILVPEGVEPGAFDVEGADDLIVDDERHGQGAAGAGGAFQVEGIGGGVRAQVALPRRRHEPGDAVAFPLGKEDALGRSGRHPFVHQRHQPGGLGLEQTNLDDVVVQQVVRETPDILLEQRHPLLNAHLGKLIGSQVSQLVARLVKCVQFLLLLHLGRNVPAQANQLADGAIVAGNGSHVQLEIAIVAAVNTSGDALAGQCGVKGTVVGAENLRGAERIVEELPGGRTAAPALEGRIGPGQAQVPADHRDAIREQSQNPLRLEEMLGLRPDARFTRFRKDAVEVFALEQGQGVGGAGGANQFPVRPAALE